MANNSPKVAFLVVCWKNREIIDECLEALGKQTYKNTAIYIIDNDSQDGTTDHIRNMYPEVHLIASNENNGFAKGNNMLIREALKDPEVTYVALINSDAMLDKDWTKELVGYLKDKQNVAAAQGVTLDYYDHNVIDADHIFVRPDFQSVQHGYIERFKESSAYPRRVFGVNAAAALYSRAFIEDQTQKILFDEKFFMYLEDMDVSFRALVTGWDNYYIPAARAYHMGSVSAKKRSSTFNIQMSIRNQSALLFKNLPFSTFLTFLPRALKFERHFFRYLETKYSLKEARKARRSRIIGILRLPFYFGDKLRVGRKRKLSARELERIMENQGIV